MIETVDTIVVLGHGSTDLQGQHDFETHQRIEVALDLFNAGYTDNIVMSGCKTFLRMVATRPIADAMKDTAIANGIPQTAVHSESASLDTIGNACYTKREILEPKGWRQIAIVTSPSHLKRSTSIFEHVLGEGYGITPIPAPEAPRKWQKMYELLGKCLEHLVLSNTEVGDDEIIYERLHNLIPGYEETTSSLILLKNYIRMFSGFDRIAR